MANTTTIQQETVASIDTAKALVDKVMSIINLVDISPFTSSKYPSTPIGFLLKLLKESGISYEEIRAFLTKWLVYAIPALEISVKAILLTNLKKMVSCSIDPRIPDKFRKRHKVMSDTNTPNEYGIDISIESIDLLDKLSVNPLSRYGGELYFGLYGIDDVYKLARADDFDAFLWFVIHKGKFPMASKVSDVTDFTTVYGASKVTKMGTEESATTLLAPIDVKFDPNGEQHSRILAGNTFTETGNGFTISMCIDAEYGEENKIIKNTIVPISDDWTSVNWYARRASYLAKNLGFGWSSSRKDETATTKFRKGNKPRNYSKERAICNLQYIDQTSTDGPLTGLVNNKLRFTILPKPLVHTPDIANGEPPWRFKRLLFDEDGNYDGKKLLYAENEGEELNLKADFASGKYTIANENDVNIDTKSGKVTWKKGVNFRSKLFETYKGLTVYEFNYDYVMSLKLFDAKVLATSLLDALINTNVSITKTQNSEIDTEIIKEKIKKIIDTDESEVSDCFYTFDNSKYEELLRKSEIKRANRQSFGNSTHPIGDVNTILEVLQEYDTVGNEQPEQVRIIDRAFVTAAKVLSEGLPSEDKNEIEINFCFDLIENLVMAIMKAILSPKVLLLLEVNQKLMGGTWEKFRLDDLIKAMWPIIQSLIKEVKDLIIQELLKLLLKQLTPIFEMLSSLLLREQAENYAELIRDIIRNCAFWFRFKKNDQDTTLDTVDYADIERGEENNEDAPNINNC